MGSVFLRGNSWVIEYRNINGKMRRESIGKKGMMTKSMARSILLDKERGVKLGQYDMLEANIPKLKDFSDEYIKYVKDILQRRSWDRYRYSMYKLLEMYGERKLSSITPKDIDDFKELRLKEVKPATVNRELSTLRQIYNLAKRWKKYYGEYPVTISGLLQENNIKERILSIDEEIRLLLSSNQYLKPILLTALQTGMRKSEILTLKWSNIDIENNVITIDQTNTKSKKTRRIPINSRLRSVLLEQKLKGGGSKYVFLSCNGLPYKYHDSIKGAFGRACQKARIEGLRFHDLRHTAATRMIEAGASIVAVSRILGHSDLKMTMRYSHPESSLFDAVEYLDQYNSKSLTDKSTDIEMIKGQ